MSAGDVRCADCGLTACDGTCRTRGMRDFTSATRAICEACGSPFANGRAFDDHQPCPFAGHVSPAVALGAKTEAVRFHSALCQIIEEIHDEEHEDNEDTDAMLESLVKIDAIAHAALSPVRVVKS